MTYLYLYKENSINSIQKYLLNAITELRISQDTETRSAVKQVSSRYIPRHREWVVVIDV